MDEREAPPRPRAVPLVLAVLTFASCGTLPSTHRSDADGDLLAGALHSLGLRREDLVIRLQHDWGAPPHPRSVAWVPVWFETLHASPMRLHRLAEDLGRAAAHLSSPAFAEADALRALVLELGVAWWRPEFEESGEPRGDAMHLSAGLEPIVADLVRALTAAARLQRQALRRLPPDAVDAVWRTCGREAHGGDRGGYLPRVDEAAHLLDRDALVRVALRTIEASQAARRALAAWLAETDPASLRTLRIETTTPFGRVELRGTGDDVHDARDVLVTVDLGGNDLYRSAAGGNASPAIPIGVAIDLGGDDVYRAAVPERPAQGAGVLGVGVLIDAGGDDVFESGALAQGAGCFGVGVLVDEVGVDRHRLERAGQGWGDFGIGLALDAAGDDAWRIDHEGQGFGAPGGVGVLADAAGNDRYAAAAHAGPIDEDDRSSRAQGVGWGQRTDGMNPSSAGGLGALVDLAGDDVYEAAAWSLGAGYWLGTGVLFEGGGDDRYQSTYYTQASAAHVASGALVDAGGNDTHLLVGRGGAGLGFGWDFASALFVDARGDDRYRARLPAIGRAALCSHAVFFELAGDDTYELGAAGLGSADVRPPPPTSTRAWPADATTIGLFIDAAGDDGYWALDPVVALPGRGNDRTWRDPKTPANPNYGVGLDAPTGSIPELAR